MYNHVRKYLGTFEGTFIHVLKYGSTSGSTYNYDETQRANPERNIRVGWAAGREEPDKFALSPVVSTSTTLLGHAHYTSYTPNTYTTPRNKSKGLNYLYSAKNFSLETGWLDVFADALVCGEAEALYLWCLQ